MIKTRQQFFNLIDSEPNKVWTSQDMKDLISSLFSIKDDQVCGNFSEGKTYEAGTLVIRGDSLCRANTYITPGLFDPGKWFIIPVNGAISNNYEPYVSLNPYSADETVTYDLRIWKARTNVPAGQAPPTDPEVTENTYWIEISAAPDTNYLPSYVAGYWKAGSQCTDAGKVWRVPGVKGAIVDTSAYSTAVDASFEDCSQIAIYDGTGNLLGTTGRLTPDGNVSIDGEGNMLVPEYIIPTNASTLLAMLTYTDPETEEVVGQLIAGQKYKAVVDGKALLFEAITQASLKTAGDPALPVGEDVETGLRYRVNLETETNTEIPTGGSSPFTTLFITGQQAGTADPVYTLQVGDVANINSFARTDVGEYLLVFNSLTNMENKCIVSMQWTSDNPTQANAWHRVLDDQIRFYVTDGPNSTTLADDHSKFTIRIDYIA